MRTGGVRAVAIAAVLSTMIMQLQVAPSQARPESQAQVETSPGGRPRVADLTPVVQGDPVRTLPRPADPPAHGRVDPPIWPAGEAEVALTAASRERPVRAGALPVWVGATGPADHDAGVRVRVLNGRDAHTKTAGTAGARGGTEGTAKALGTRGSDDPIRISLESPSAERVTVSLDYTGFTEAYGGSYGSRLRLARLPACASTTPERPECGDLTPLPTRNDGENGTLSADVGLAAGQATVLALAAAPESDKGDYKATTLSSSATWQVGGNSGDFTWSYPLRVPPVPGGLDPDLAIGYSSGSVDGRTANTNNQPSWVGEGFDLWPGYVERSYKPCSQDGAPKSNGVDPGDQCWAYDNATVTWNGKGGELIKAGDGTWRMKGDDGTRFERLTAASTGNGDDDGEYWKATTTDGTQYFFGLNRLPGWTSERPQTGSAWTTPVFGDDAGEPCHDAAGFDRSWCRQAWRWNLDYVVDTNGNAIAYYYTKETNRYGRNVSTSADTSYDRGGHLERIEYGLRTGALFAGPPAKVVFTTAERCLPDSAFDCASGKIGDRPERWPDVPWDQNCTSDCTKHGKISPTFWSRKRLTGVTTQIRRADGTYRDVDAWKLSHIWGDADIDRALLLRSIEHTGRAGGTAVTLPKVTFNHVQLMNRVDRSGDDIPPFIKYRVGAIYDEYGGQVDVDYSTTDCTLSDLPTPETNTRRCFPTYWQPPGHDEPIRDWFHKYVVTRTVVSDRTARAPDMVTTYTYLGGAAWHFDDDDGLTKTKEKTWSQWRGYGRVRVTTGSADQPLSRTEHLFLRGMDGDRRAPSGGVKSVTVSDDEGGTHVDHEGLAGFELQRTEYTGPDGVVYTRTVNTPWRHETARRVRSWGTTVANLTGVATTRTWTALSDGGRRQTRVDTAHDTVTGLPLQVDDQADVSTASDDLCTRTTYAINATAWLRELPSRVETVAARCSATPDRSRQLVSDTRTSYDGRGFGEAPTKGDATMVEEIASHDGTTARYIPVARTGYDPYGRSVSVKDALGNTTTTAYTETAGLTVKTTVTGPPATPGVPGSAHVTTTVLDPAWGLPTAETDPGGRTTTIAYDSLGRTVKVWAGLPTSATPTAEYAYRIEEGKIAAVTTRTPTPEGGQRVRHDLYDGLLRQRQTQVEGPDGGRVIEDTFYDSRGNVTRTYAPYYATGAPTPSLFGVADPGDVEAQVQTDHDGLGRVTVERQLIGGNDTREIWRTVTTYGGDWVAVDPPDGGIPTRTYTDARGHTTEVRQYQGDSPTGAYTASTYTYTPGGELATIADAAGNAWTTGYDLRGRQIRVEDPDRGTTRYTYDDLDRVTSETDARGRTLVHRYDPLGREIETREGSADGTLLRSWTYDTLRKGLLTSATAHAGGRSYTSRIDVYDRQNRPVRQTVTIPSGEGALAGDYTFSTAYNPDGSVQSTGFPAAGDLPAETVGVVYDALARPVRLTGSLGAYVTATAYSRTGRPLQYALNAGGKTVYQTFTWEYGTDRLATSRVDREGVAGVDREARYTYNPAGDFTAISDVSRSGTDTQCFRYDHLRRLSEAWTQASASCAAAPTPGAIGGPAPYWHGYTYDAAGNRATETWHGLNGQADTRRDYTYDRPGSGHLLVEVAQSGGAGARTDSFGYDPTGNTVSRTGPTAAQSLTWDSFGDLSSVTEAGSTTSFVYDVDGERLLRRDPSGVTLYLAGMEVRLAKGASTVTATRYYAHNGETVAVRTGRGVSLLAADHQDTALLAVDAATQELTQRRFTPFGAPRGTAVGIWPDERAFVGGTADRATGLTHLGAREYDPAIGRFLSVDPLFNMEYPQSWNGYSYANHSPITLSDPDGLDGPLRGNTNCYYSGKGCTRTPPCWGWECTGAGFRWYVAPKPRSDCWGWECTDGGGTADRWTPRYSTPVYKAPVRRCDWKCKLKNGAVWTGKAAWNGIQFAIEHRAEILAGCALVLSTVAIGTVCAVAGTINSAGTAIYQFHKGNTKDGLLNLAGMGLGGAGNGFHLAGRMAAKRSGKLLLKSERVMARKSPEIPGLKPAGRLDRAQWNMRTAHRMRVSRRAIQRANTWHLRSLRMGRGDLNYNYRGYMLTMAPPILGNYG